MDEKNYRMLLNKIYESYTDNCKDFDYRGMETQMGGDGFLYASLNYLKRQGLIDTYISKSPEGFFSFEGFARMTPKGIAFLGKDDGIGDELNSVTIKIHEDTIKKMIESRILQSNLSDSEKQSNLKLLRLLPAVGIQRLVTLLLEKGVENVPSLIQMIQNA